jgi:hypothetical protein
MTSHGTVCPAGSVQVTDQTECHGAAKTFLISTGHVTTNVPAHPTVSNAAYVSGCYEGAGGSVGAEGNGNVHFNTVNNQPATKLGYRICKAI